MESYLSLAFADLCEQFGIDRVDEAVVEWIDDGVYDAAVRERAAKIGVDLGPRNYIQDFHRDFHKDGPVGYEFCSRCDKVLSEFR